MDESIKRIQKMETIMNKSEDMIREFEEALALFKKRQENYKILEKYYFSETWQKDKKLDNDGKIPKDMPTGVLSEDGIWNLSIKNKEIGIELIKIGLSMIEG